MKKSKIYLVLGTFILAIVSFIATLAFKKQHSIAAKSKAVFCGMNASGNLGSPPFTVTKVLGSATVYVGLFTLSNPFCPTVICSSTVVTSTGAHKIYH